MLSASLALAVSLAGAPSDSPGTPAAPDGAPTFDDEDLPLLPLASLHRPVPKEVEPGREPRLLGCAAKPLPPLTERLPFGPGERLSYDIALLGIRTGKLHVRVGERSVVDGVGTYPIHAQARSDGFLEVLGDFDARMVSFFDPHALKPVRMVNRTVVAQPFAKDPIVSREDGAFAPAHIVGGGGAGGAGVAVGGDVNARLRRTAADGNLDKTARLKSSADVVDLLSVVYYLRARTLAPGAPFCFELYHRRKLWRVEGRVADEPAVARPPIGVRRAIRLDAHVTRIGGASPPPPRPVVAFLADDADRAPLLVQTPHPLGTIEVRLWSHTRGRRLVGR